MKPVDKMEQNSKFAFDECRELDTTLGGGVVLCYRESSKLAHAPALADNDAENLDVSRVGELDSQRWLVNAENFSSVLGPYKLKKCKHQRRLSKRVGDRRLDYIFIIFDRSRQRHSVRECRKR